VKIRTGDELRCDFSCFIYKHDDHIGDHTTNDASRTIP
jgi:hypothetical protein